MSDKKKILKLRDMMKKQIEHYEEHKDEIESQYFNKDYLLFVKPTYIENWPDRLKRLSINQQGIKLPIKEAKLLGSSLMEFGEAFTDKWGEEISNSDRLLLITDLKERFDSIIEFFPKGAFIRLGSRSPKDSYLFFKNPRVLNGTEAIKMLTGSSERIYDDLMLAIMNEYEPYIFVREWIDIPKWCEFRCFMKGRKLQGVSQYYYHDYYEEIKNNHSIIQSLIFKFFKKFEESCHLDDVIFDVFLELDKEIESSEVKLLEINPYSNTLTDPCLYDWDEDEMFKISFKYLEN